MTIKTNTLIVGGGFAGATAAQQLSDAGVDVVLADRKDYFEVTFANLRNLADFGAMGDKSRAKYQDFIKGQFVHSGIQSLNDTRAILENGDEVQFERAIIATGSRYSSFSLAKSVDAVTFDQRSAELKQGNQDLAQATSVLIIGGGAVGVELAGEIAFKYPNIKVTLAEAGDSVLGGYSAKAQLKATEQLKALGIAIKTNRRFQQNGESYIDANSGESIKADVVYTAVGVQPNSEFMQAELASSLTEKGYITVDDFYKVKGTKNLYAVGDVADLPDLKLGAFAAPQAKKLASNLIAQDKGKAPKPHSKAPQMGMFPIGQQKGVAQLPFATVTWKFIIDMKNKDLFVGKTFKDLAVS